MKNKALEVYFQDFADFRSEVKQALKKRKKLMQPKHRIYFDSVASFRKFMTAQKIEILTVISHKNPNTIYELAKLVDRDFAAVLRDCTSLASTGFIHLKDVGNNKNSKKPELKFNYTCIMIHLPSAPYNIQFDNAA